MDNLRWLIEYNPAADETLRPAGDPKPLTRRLRECADEIERLRRDYAILLERWKEATSGRDPLSQALNEGDGVYRP